MPLELDQHKAIAGKEGRPVLNRTTEPDPPIPESWKVGLVTVQAEAMERQRLAVHLKAAGAPVRHRSPRHLQPVAVAAANTRIVTPNGS